MNQDRLLKIAIALSVIYAAAFFAAESRITPLIVSWYGNSQPVFFASSAIIGINLILFFFSLIRTKTITLSAWILCVIQIPLFCRLFIDFHQGFENSGFITEGSVGLVDWLAFTGIHALRAVDLPDIMDIFSINFVKISYQGNIITAFLLAMYIMVSVSVLWTFYQKGIARIFSSEPEQQKSPSKILKWMPPALFILSILASIFLLFQSGLSIVESLMLLPDSLLLAIDFGDACQMFNWSFQAAPTETVPNAALAFFRFAAGFYLIVCAHTLYQRFSGPGPASVNQLAAICLSTEYADEERLEAILKIEQLGMFADSAVPCLIKLLVDNNAKIREESARVLNELDPEWISSEAVIDDLSNFTKVLSKGNDGAKMAAMGVLSEIGPPSEPAIKPLIKLLEDPDDTIRCLAAETLGSIGPASSTAVPALINLFSGDDDILTGIATEALEKIGPAAIAYLIDLLLNDNENIRDTALDILNRADEKWTESEYAVQAVDVFVDELSDVLSSLRDVAAKMLGYIGPVASKAVPDLILLLTESDAKIRNASFTALDQIDPTWPESEDAAERITDLAISLADSDKDVRQSAIKALKQIDPKWYLKEQIEEVIPHYIDALGHSLDSTRCAGINALAVLGPAAIDAMPQLIECLSDKEAIVRKHAFSALSKIDPDWKKSDLMTRWAKDRMEKFSDPDWKIRAASAAALGKIRYVDSIGNIVRLLIDQDRQVRKTAYEALMNISPKWPGHRKAKLAIPTFLSGLKDSKWSARMAAAEALSKFGPVAGHTAPYLVKATTDRIGDVVTAAKHALDKVDPDKKFRKKELSSNERKARNPGQVFMDDLDLKSPDAVTILARALVHKDREIRVISKKILTKVGPKWPQTKAARKALPFLIESLSDSQWIIRSEAALALGLFKQLAVKAVPKLGKATSTDSSIDVRNSAKKALTMIDPDGKLMDEINKNLESEIGVLELEMG
ncbi:HEAT repeat domain-containing protein [Desulfobacterales bacterium HSG16]|nr:HEAT repeat domain-containing protein [Desulfobacterales bacterium HSG16]